MTNNTLEKRITTIPIQKNEDPSAQTLLKIAEDSLAEDKALDVTRISLQGKSAMADDMVIATGTSARHVGAIANHLRERLKAGGAKGVAVEGLEQCDWVLVDGGDIIVHLFRPEVRAFYNLEKMWLGDVVSADPPEHVKTAGL
ncbi:ribosome silencing factor [Varunaivibrio sulfuroxidans]|uniref:Ribosomal silencing factor RsfS n=1 Tax=Varunaivibrio sulfuroxidans TaxID=1773489 RepID=A0A4V2UN63_9PROT|nr:ribosome silencing factor [Varunaivibrio sulfuroxidans]TCS60871.1 ribosome-associated protein [Varunaivibrio sulfuroxidans]WES31718.1 ribosome silencing factor [Varunaivibrio sulfuroxidans]